MTVVACLPCHEHIPEHWTKPSFASQRHHLGEQTTIPLFASRVSFKKERSWSVVDLGHHFGEKRIKAVLALQSYFEDELHQKRNIVPKIDSFGCGKEIISSMSDFYEKDGTNGDSEDVSWSCVDIRDTGQKIKLRMTGRRKNGQQKNGKQQKGDDGNTYRRKSESQRSRRPSQGNGSSGMDGSGEGSGNGDESSDEEEDDCDDDGEDEQDDEEEEDEEEEEEEEDEMEEEIEEDMDNGSPMAVQEVEEGASGCVVGQPAQKSLELKRLEFENPGPKVASGTLDVQDSGGKNDSSETRSRQSSSESIIAPAVPGTPITLSGVIWKETMGGVLVVNLKWRNKMYCGSLIDKSRHNWATLRNVEDVKEPKLSSIIPTTKRGKGKKGKLKGSAYTGNPLSPKMTAKRGPRFHHSKGKHGKDSFVRPRTKRGLGSDNTAEGTRTRRRSCTAKMSVSPSPSPTPLIECPERNCNKKYKHINGLRYHQAHAHLDSNADPDDKDSDEEEDVKSADLKEPLSAHSKSSGSDDVKPLSRRKAKNQKSHSGNKTADAAPGEDSVENEMKSVQVEETEKKNDVANIKTEPEEPDKPKEKNDALSAPNILEEAAKIIFDGPPVTGAQELVVNPGIFARMTSQAMMAPSHGDDYKYVSYEPMAESITAYTEKNGTSVEEQGMDVTVKEEVIDEGNANMGKMPCCKNGTEDSLKVEGIDMPCGSEKSRQLTVESVAGVPGTEQTKWLADKDVKPGDNVRKSSQEDGIGVAKETSQIKTSAAEIRSLPGYQHFRLPTSGTSGGYVSLASEEKGSKPLTLETARPETKEPQRASGCKKESEGTAKKPFEKQENKPMVWRLHGTPSTSTASFQLSCESKNPSSRTRYINLGSSKKAPARSVVTARSIWVPDVHPALTQKIPGDGVPGQEVLPLKPLNSQETANNSKTWSDLCEEEKEDERTRHESDKADDDRPKASVGVKPRAVGVAHPFNAEKSDCELPRASIASFTGSDSVKVLYSKSSSPKLSLDLAHTDMSEVKKVRVEKTLEVPVGEVVPLAKTSRSAVASSETRAAVVVGSDGTEQFSGGRATLSDSRVPQTIGAATSQRERHDQTSYASSGTERSSPWRPKITYSPPVESGPQSLREAGQRYLAPETTSSLLLRKANRRSPASDIERSSPVRSSAGGYSGIGPGRQTPEKDTPKKLPQRGSDMRLPFSNLDERSANRDRMPGLPFGDMGRRSPEKDISGRLSVKSARELFNYRESEARSPHRDTASSGPRREYDRSPLRNSGRRSPGARRSPDRETLPRSSYRDTSPVPSSREGSRHSPYRDSGRNKAPRDSESLSQRREARSPEGEARMAENTRGYSGSKLDTRGTKEGAGSVDSQRMTGESKLPRLTEEQAMMLQLRAPFYQYQGAAPDSAAREAVENYMMYLSRLPIHAALDPRLLQGYPMLSAAQVPLLVQSPKETSVTKEERTKETSEDARNKSTGPKHEIPRSRGVPFSERSDGDRVPSKRHLEASSRSSSSKGSEKPEYESTPSKRSKASESRSAGESVDDREGSRMQYKKLEQQVLEQAYQQKMDAFYQLQTEKNLKQKAEEKNSSRCKVSPGTSTSRIKPSAELRTSKKEDSVLSGSRAYERDRTSSKEDKSRLSPVNRPSGSTVSESTHSRTSSRNSDNKSPASGSYPGFLATQNLPANHGLSNSYEQAALAMQGIPPFIMPSPYHLPPGIMMTNTLIAAGAQFHNTVASRGLDPKHDPSWHSSSSTTTKARGPTRDDESSDFDTRDYSSRTKKDTAGSGGSKATASSPGPSKQELEKERSRERSRGTTEYDEEKQRTLKDNPALHGAQSLSSNLAFRRGDMSSGIDSAHLNPSLPRLMYPPSQGNFRPSPDHPYIPYPRK